MIAQKPETFVRFGLRTLTKHLGCSPKLSHPLSLVAIGFFFKKKNIFHFGYDT